MMNGTATKWEKEENEKTVNIWYEAYTERSMEQIEALQPLSTKTSPSCIFNGIAGFFVSFFVFGDPKAGLHTEEL
jgi:hypothetical protein